MSDETIMIGGVLYRQSTDDDPDDLFVDHGLVLVPVDPEGLPPNPVAEMLSESAERNRPPDQDETSTGVPARSLPPRSPSTGAPGPGTPGAPPIARFVPPFCRVCASPQYLVRKFNGGDPIEFYWNTCECEETAVRGYVVSAEGRHIEIKVDRFTMHYPTVGSRVVLYERVGSSVEATDG